VAEWRRLVKGPATEPCIQAADLHGEVHMNADAKRRAELRAAAIAVTFFILCAVAAFHS